MSVSSDYYDLDQDNTLGGNNPSILKIPSQKAIKEALNTKQDLLTASTGITITQSQDTRSTASVVTVGTNRWQGVAYGNGKFVAVGNDGYTAYSSDGSTWSTPTQVGTNAWYSITFANGKFVAVGNAGYTTTTTDGVTWTTPTQISGITNYRLSSVRYGNGIYCAISYSGYSVISTDGINWTTPTSQFSNYVSNAYVCFDGSQFVLAYNTSAGDRTRVLTSTDGLNWVTTGTTTSFGSPASIAYGNGNYIIGAVTGNITYSSNLVDWSTATRILGTVESIYFDGTQFIAVGRREITSSTYKYSTVTSTDGINWTTPVDIGDSASSSVITYGFLSITSNGNGKFVAVGDRGATTTFTLGDGQLYISANIDDTLSSTSENPVQNKVITQVIGDIETLLYNINSGSSS